MILKIIQSLLRAVSRRIYFFFSQYGLTQVNMYLLGDTSLAKLILQLSHKDSITSLPVTKLSLLSTIKCKFMHCDTVTFSEKKINKSPFLPVADAEIGNTLKV